MRARLTLQAVVHLLDALIGCLYRRLEAFFHKIFRIIEAYVGELHAFLLDLFFDFVHSPHELSFFAHMLRKFILKFAYLLFEVYFFYYMFPFELFYVATKVLGKLYPEIVILARSDTVLVFDHF